MSPFLFSIVAVAALLFGLVAAVRWLLGVWRGPGRDAPLNDNPET